MPAQIHVYAGDGLWRGLGGSPNVVVDLELDFKLRTDRPTYKGPGNPANNVGCRNGVDRQNYAGTINFANGPVDVRDLNITSRQTVVGANHKLDNFRLTSTYSGDGGGGQLDCKHSSVDNLRVSRFEIDPATTDDRFNGIYGHHFTAHRGMIRRTVDAIGVYNPSGGRADVVLSGMWLGQLAWYDDDRPGAGNGHTDGTHNDLLQQGSSRGVAIIGSFLQGAKYNALNPANVTLDPDGLEMVLAAGNGVTPLALGSGNSSNRWPQSGQGWLAQHSAYTPVDDLVLEDSWLWNLDAGFKTSSRAFYAGADQYKRIENVSVRRNKFGGVWRDYGGTHRFYPIRIDTNTVLNGVDYTGRAGAWVDNDGRDHGNVWVSGPFAGQRVTYRVDQAPAPTL